MSVVNVNPDLFSGTDSQKLSSAIMSLNDTGGVIIITRPMTLDTDVVITHDSEQHDLIQFVGEGVAEIDLNGHTFKGSNSNHTGNQGGITFERLRIRDSQENASLFDADNLIRVFVKNCSVSNLKSICSSVSTYIQTVYIDNCYIRNCDCVVENQAGTKAYDVRLYDNVIEKCTRAVRCFNTFGVWIQNNLIEGLQGCPIYLGTGQRKTVISSNYFETNNSTYEEKGASVLDIYTTSGYEINVAFENNFVVQHINSGGSIDKTIILPPNEIVGSVIVRGNYCYPGAMLVSAVTVRKYANLLYYANTTHETEYDQGQYNCSTYATVITSGMINGLFAN